MTRSIFAPSRRDRKKTKFTRAFLNGVDVTKDCQVADDRAGRVLLLKRNPAGRHYRDPATGNVAREWLCGRVEIGRT